MAIRSILVVLYDLQTAADHLRAAAGLASRHGAVLEVLACTLTVDIDAMAASVGVVPLVMTDHDRAAEADAWTAVLAPQLARLDPAVAHDNTIGPLAVVVDRIRQRARYCDLVIFGHDPASGRDGIGLIEEVLLSCRRPVLLLPRSDPLPGPILQAVIGWDDSDAALAAVRAALPLLRDGTMTRILVFDPNDKSPEQSDAAVPLARYLTLHGAQSEVSVQPRSSGTSVAGSLLAQATGADLLILGGYGHSRLRERLFGGTTREILRTSTVPVLLAH